MLTACRDFGGDKAGERRCAGSETTGTSRGRRMAEAALALDMALQLEPSHAKASYNPLATTP